MVDYNIDLYIGSVGSGKTTTAAALCIKQLKKNKRSKHPINVYSNVNIIGTRVIDFEHDLGQFDTSDSLIVLDEAGLIADNRNFKSNFAGSEGKQRLTFLKLHRHYKCNIAFFSQGLDIDLKIRTLAKRIFIVKRCSLLPFLCRIKRVSRKIGISDITKELIDEYYFVPLSSRFVFMPRYRKYFNSFEAPELPQKEWTIY